MFLMNTILIEGIWLVCGRSEYRLCRRGGILLAGLGRLFHRLILVFEFVMSRIFHLGLVGVALFG